MLLPQLPDQVADLDDLQGVQAHRGLVQDDVPRIAQQRLGNAHTLPVALGQVADQPLLHLGQAGLPDDPVHLAGNLLARNALGLRHKAQILPGRLVGVERRDLRQVADALLGLPRLLEDVVPVDLHLAGRGRQAPCHDVHRRGFAGTVGTQKAVDMALPDGEGNVVHRREVAVPFGQVFHRYHRKMSPPLHGFIVIVGANRNKVLKILCQLCGNCPVFAPESALLAPKRPRTALCRLPEGVNRG